MRSPLNLLRYKRATSERYNCKVFIAVRTACNVNIITEDYTEWNVAYVASDCWKHRKCKYFPHMHTNHISGICYWNTNCTDCTDYMWVYKVRNLNERQMCVCWRHIPTLRLVTHHYRFVTASIIMPLFILIFWRAITQSVIFTLKYTLCIDISVHLTEQTERCSQPCLSGFSVSASECNLSRWSFNLLCFCCPLMKAWCSYTQERHAEVEFIYLHNKRLYICIIIYYKVHYETIQII